MIKPPQKIGLQPLRNAFSATLFSPDIHGQAKMELQPQDMPLYPATNPYLIVPTNPLPPRPPPNIKTFESNPLPVASHMCSLERPIMKSKFYLVLAALAVGLMTLVAAPAQASTPGAHPRSVSFHSRGPRMHNHGMYAHR